MRRNRGFTLIELMIVVAIIGVLSAIAIPSFVKYIRRAKTTEATMNLRKMYDGAVAYYVGEHADSSGNIANKRFPDPGPPVPSLGALTASMQSGMRYQSAPSEWKQGGWSALEFSIADAQMFSYQFDNQAVGAEGTKASANMIAKGDQDGDGLYSTFMRSMHGTLEGVEGGVAMYSVNETE